MGPRPNVIRADTLDLQDHDAPSAKDHSNRPAHPSPLGEGPPAPHQEASLRHVAEERSAERESLEAWGSARSSHESDHIDDRPLYVEEDAYEPRGTRLDEAAIQLNGGIGTDIDGETLVGEIDDMDGEPDDRIDEEMLDDRVSSSPSIEGEGTYSESTLRSRLHPPPFQTAFPFSTMFCFSQESASKETLHQSSVYDAKSNIRKASEGFGFAAEGIKHLLADDENDCLPFNAGADVHKPGDGLSGGVEFPVIPDDIDWNSVYALHAFIATVDGQANATKGEVMTLLDDSNSYWWLVRLIKDGSIGYLPAEHIETPMERLARFNKHKNVELSSSHLTDQTPPVEKKSKSSKLGPLFQKEKERRVQFSRLISQTSSAPVWSDDEGDSADEAERPSFGLHSQTNGPELRDVTMAELDRDNLQAETNDAMEIDTPMQHNGDGRISPLLDSAGRVNGDQGSPERTPSISRNGTIRNTDSFFKDNTAEPRKISLTPKIARDDVDSDYRQSGDSADRTTDIFDQIERQNSLSEMQKEEKRKREKKPGMLSGLFKRKDKKIKVDEAAGGTVVRQEGESPVARDASQPPRSPKSNSSPQTPVTTKRSGSGKLSKAPPQSMGNGSLKAPKKKWDGKDTDSPSFDVSPNSEVSASPTSAMTTSSSDQQNPYTTPSRNVTMERDPTIPAYSSDHEQPGQFANVSNGVQRQDFTQPQVDRFVTASEVLYRQSDHSEPGDDYPAPISPVDGSMDDPTYHSFKSDDVAMHDSPIDEQNQFDSSSNNTLANGPHQNGVYKSTITNLMTSGDWSYPMSQHAPNESSPATSANGLSWQTQPQESEWDDAALRKYLNEQSHSDTKDLLHLVNDTTGVPPLPADHPTMLQFGFQEHQKKLDDMSSELDNMLMDFMARKSAKNRVRTR